jgi:NTE family protein
MYVKPGQGQSINTTCMETGRRWRFRQKVRANEFAISMGDGALGYADASRIPVAAAMAMSAAFPFFFTPLAVSTQRAWLKPDFNVKSRTTQEMTPAYAEYHLADGGIYDNLGLEPIFDASKMELRREVVCDFLIALDGGAPLAPKRWGRFSQRFGLTTRTVDVMSSQQRHLRVRGLVNAIKAGSVKGIIARIEEPGRVAVESALRRSEMLLVNRAASINNLDWLSIGDAKKAASIPTRLISGTLENRTLAERQGYEATYAQLHLYG